MRGLVLRTIAAIILNGLVGCGPRSDAIVVITLLSCFWTFNNFLYIWLTTAGGPGSYTNVIATDIYIKAFIEYQLGYSSAIGVFAAMLMAAFALVYLRVVARREFQEIL